MDISGYGFFLSAYCGGSSALLSMLAAWSVFGPKATVAVPATGVGAVAITAVLLGFALRYDLAPPQDAPSQETPNLIVDIATVEAGTIIGGLVTVWLLSSL